MSRRGVVVVGSLTALLVLAVVLWRAEDSSNPAPEVRHGGRGIRRGGAEGPSSPECRHPFVPARVGASWDYALTTRDRSAELRLEVVSTRETPDGRIAVEWLGSVDAEGARRRARWTARTTCGDSEAEEPWLAPMEQLAGLRARHGWTWPSRLETGASFGGVALLQSPSGLAPLRVERRYEVVGRESISFGGERRRGWRLHYREEQSYGDVAEAIEGTVHVAENVGLVRLEARALSAAHGEPAFVMQLSNRGTGRD